MINCGEKLIDPDQEVMVDDGEHDSICEIRDFLIHNNPKMTIEKAEDLGRFYCNYIHGQIMIYCIHRHRSGRGETNVISFYVIKDKVPVCIDWFLQDLLGLRTHKNFNGCVIKGSKDDMGWEVVYMASRKLFGDGYRFKHRWL